LKNEESTEQGDQTGLIVAYWAIVYLGQDFESYRRRYPKYWATVVHGKTCAFILTNIERAI
jgi:hypothetical protein